MTFVSLFKSFLAVATLAAMSDAAFVPKVTSAPRFGKTSLNMAGIKVALQCSDSGNYLARCNNCCDGAYPDNAFVHVSEGEMAGAPWAHWTIENLGDQKYTFQADSSKCLARCNSCISGGAYPDNAAVHVSESDAKSHGYAQWVLETLSPGLYALKSADSGNYLGRCNSCIPSGAYPDSAFVHVKPSEIDGATWAHWKIQLIP